MLKVSVPLHRPSLLVILCALAWAAPARAGQSVPPAAIEQGYHLLWSGAQAGAQQYFDDLSKAHPDDLAARFGLLMAMHDRLDCDDTLQPVFERGLDAFIDRTDQQYSRNSRDDRALFYRGFARMVRGYYKIENDQSLLGAARDAAHGKADMETYLKTHPDDPDALLVIGVYNYYASLAPAYLHVLRWFLFLPAGDKVNGLKQIERAAATSRLFAPEAQMLLIEIYSTYESRPRDAIAIGQRLLAEYPANDDVENALADLYQSPSEDDKDRAAAAYQAIVTRRKNDETLDGVALRDRALLGLASVRFDEWRCDDALAALTPVIDAPPAAPAWVLPQFLIQRANFRLLMNDPGGADDAKRVIANPRMVKWRKDATALLATLSKRTAAEARTYAALIPANRLTAEQEWAPAREAYERLAASAPQEVQVRYRLAYLDFASGDTDEARPALSALAGTKSAPDWLRAWSFLFEARADDLAGRRETAKKEYQTVVDNFGQQRAAEAARVGLVTPYRRPEAVR